MEYRRLKSLQTNVSALGLGCASLGSRVGRRQSLDMVGLALDSGINLFDTAPLYGEGDSESILGRALRGRRQNIVISTKVGWLPSMPLRLASKSKGFVRYLLEAMPSSRGRALQALAQNFIRSQNVVSLRRSSILKSVDSSLRRLQTDYIDILLLHKSPSSLELEGTLATLDSLVGQGKVRTYGISPPLSEAAAWLGPQRGRIALLQVELHALNWAASEQVLALAERNGIDIVAREPFAQGRLIPGQSTASGTLGFLGKPYEARYDFLQVPRTRTVKQAALKLLLQNPAVAAVLIGMSTPRHLEENLGALVVPPLSAQELAEIDRASSA